ncbi:MAG: rod shape-determining protein MreC [Fimbriimonadaceae bacterium]
MIALLAVGIALGRYQTINRNHGVPDPISSAVQFVVGPSAAGIAAAWDSAGGFVDGVLSAPRLRAENADLRAQIQALALYDEQVRFYQAEIERLRALMDMPPVPGRRRIPAAVIGYFPLENRITISAGSRQGVRKDLPVVTADGLVGVVQTVDDNASQVTLISSARLRVGALVRRDPPPVGIIRGEAPNVMMLEFLDSNATLQVGDLVVTSGFSEFIPANIPIGRIVRIEDDREFGAKRCQVFPNVQVGSIREVMVLR